MSDAAVPVAPGSNLDAVRQHNLSTVLTLVHRAGALSRSELTRATGLNRSTIAALVIELAALGFVAEAEPRAATGVGRPSPMVTANPAVVAVSVNPEVDAVTVGMVGLDGTLHRQLRQPTKKPATAAEAAGLVAAALEELRATFDIPVRTVAIGAAVPGLVREADGVVRLAPHLGWVDAPFAALLTAATGLPASVANDANLGAHAERLYGAGVGVDDLVYLNGGPGGVGAGVIAGGASLTGWSGYAGELGHTLVNSAGVRCHCGSTGCLETEVGQAPLLALLGMDAAEADALDARLRESVDPVVHAEVRRQLGFLAVAIANAVNAFNPRLVVLGGFLAALHAAAPEVLQDAVRERTLAASGDGLGIVRAELGARLLTVAAAELAFEQLLADPASAAC
ncbi:MAG TPA: ROK family protein [Humibacter sp.]|nr:ROK family protein [Humibacter sp.]